MLRLGQKLEQLAGGIAIAGDELRGGGRAGLCAEAPRVLARAARAGREHGAAHARHAHERLVAALTGPGEAAREHLVGRLERRAVALELGRLPRPRLGQTADAIPLEHADRALQLLRIDPGCGHDPERRDAGTPDPHDGRVRRPVDDEGAARHGKARPRPRGRRDAEAPPVGRDGEREIAV